MLKKLFLLTVIAGLLIGIIVKDLLSIPFYALFVGGGFSLIFWLTLRFINKLLGQKYQNRINKTGMVICPILFMILSWFIFFPLQQKFYLKDL
jgi:uncharacterized membrane protein